jgi:hypothetical protein
MLRRLQYTCLVLSGAAAHGGVSVRPPALAVYLPWQDAVKTKTVNAALGVVCRVLNLAASEWMDEQGMTWLATAPKIKLFAVTDARSPYPLTQRESLWRARTDSNRRPPGS